MTEDEQRQYSVLMLRLSRTKDLLKRGGKFTSLVTQSLVTKPIRGDDPVGDSFKDEPSIHYQAHQRLNNFHSLVKHTTPRFASTQGSHQNLAENATRRSPISMSTSVMGDAEVGTGDSIEQHAAVDDETSRQAHKDQPVGSVGATLRPGGQFIQRRLGAKNSEAVLVPRSNPLTPPTQSFQSPAMTNAWFDANRALQSVHMRGAAQTPIVETPFKVHPSAHESISPWHAAGKLAERRSWPSSQTSKNIAHADNAPEFQLGVRNEPAQFDSVARSLDDVGRIRSVPDELPIKSELQLSTRKLHDGEASSTSFGGSFANNDTPNEIELDFSFSPINHSNRAFPIRVNPATSLQPSSTLPQAPPFKIIPISRPFAPSNSGAIARSHSSLLIPRRPSPSANRDIDERRSVDQELISIDKNEIRPDEQLTEAAAGLLRCCEQQSPGCKQLCAKDVSKEQVSAHPYVRQM